MSGKSKLKRWGRGLGRTAPLLLLALILMSGDAFAQAAETPALSIDLGTGDGLTARVLQLTALITVLSLAPSILIMTTSFVRIVVVLSLLRTAIGLQQAPPNVVIVSLSLFLTAFVMQPVWDEAYQMGIGPVMREEMTMDEAFPRVTAPLKVFMAAQTREADLELFINMARLETPPQDAVDVPMRVLVPAFMISELRRAFEIGFMLFVPFLIIDLVVSSLLMSMGMMMVPPVTISLPFKLIFFVLVDGWRLVAGSLIESFASGVPPGG
ncbi:MAG: flagellar type III secretion system pore protein FliP [Hyphomonadaceae bacterium]|nr:flagellar type III secretion system pore protein FliP [Hyphomonadaceae bacterium]